jgi:two-component system sensor histidine kinase KdpD
LYALSREVASVDDPAQVAKVVARHASAIFSARAAVYVAASSGELEVLGASPDDTALDERDRVVATWAFEHGELAGHGTDTLPAALSICAPLRSTHMIGVLALVPQRPASLRAEQRAFLDAFCRQAAVALERVRLAAEARTSALRVKTEEMRSSLLSAVSHDLRTPLGSITGAATSLRDDRELSAETRAELVEAICDEAARLERLVANLLDMTRLQAGEVSLRRDWVPLEEIISSALAHSEDRLGPRKVRVELAPDLPLVFVDPVLLDQLFINLFENAAKYTPPDTPIDVSAHLDGKSIAVEVIDHGPGLPPGSERQVFEKFYRGSHTGIPGAGLGLPICQAIGEAHGGTIRAERRPGAGAVFVITIPIGGTPPAVGQRQGNSP